MSTKTGTPAYAFLSQPPPALQKRQRNLATSQPPSVPLPPTPPQVSSADTSIASWAAQVQPGSPGTPSPRRSSLSCQRRPSLVRRRSGSRIAHIRVPSNSQSFVHLIETPSPHYSASPSATNFVPNTADLRAQGYTIFVSLPPDTPQSAFPFRPKQADPHPPRTPSAKPTKSLKSFRSLTGLRRGRSGATPSSPTKKDNASAHAPGSPTKPASPTSLKRVRSGSRSRTKPNSPTTAHRRAMHRKAQINATLANEAALSQFLGGGKIETHAQALVPKGDAVWRDGKGGLWRDEAERVEYVPLLGDGKENDSPTSPGREWIRFSGSCTGDGRDSPRKATALLDFVTQNDDDEARAARRGSAGSISTAEMMTKQPMNIDQDVGKLVWLPSTGTTSGGVKRTTRRRVHRPTPLTISPHTSPSASVVASAFEDSFAPVVIPPPTPAPVTRPAAVVSSSSTLALPLLGNASGPASPMSFSGETQKTLKSKASKSKLKKLFRI